MKIYFAGSMKGGGSGREIYADLISYLKKHGEVLTELVGDNVTDPFGEKDLPAEFIHDRDVEWLLSSDVVVADVSNPSLGVGYELGRAVENNKKILCLFKPFGEKKLSSMISGSKSVVVKEYFGLDEAKRVIDDFFNSL